MLIVILLSTAGCQRSLIGRTEIDEIIFIRILGFDKGIIEDTNRVEWDEGEDGEERDAEGDNDKVTMTISAKKGQQAGGGNGGQYPELFLS